jgi:hypothetical protein
MIWLASLHWWQLVCHLMNGTANGQGSLGSLSHTCGCLAPSCNPQHTFICCRRAGVPGPSVQHSASGRQGDAAVRGSAPRCPPAARSADVAPLPPPRHPAGKLPCIWPAERVAGNHKQGMSACHMFRFGHASCIAYCFCSRAPLQLLGICQADGLLFLATELMQGGNLQSHLHRPELRFYARCLPRGPL